MSPPLYCAALVKNEEHRYLKEFLSFYEQVVDGFFWLDNASEDKTFEIINNHPKTIAAIQDQTPFSKEKILRSKLFDLYRTKITEEISWIVTPDADEIFEDRWLSEVKNMIDQKEICHYSHRFLHFWGDRVHYRIDGLWNPNRQYGIRLFKLDKKKPYMWSATPFACGSVPQSVLREKGLNSSIYIRHYGYASPLDIKKKYALYSQKETIPYHQRSHILSIIQPPTLKKYIPTIKIEPPAPPPAPLLDSELPPVTIGGPIRNRAWILPDHLSALESLDYPKHLISFLYLVNDSKDETKKILEEFKNTKGHLYNSFQIIEKNLNQVEDTRNEFSRIHHIFNSLCELRNLWLDSIPRGNWAFSVDSDILCPPKTLRKLVNNRKDICSAFISNEFIPKQLEKTRGNILKFISPARTRCFHVKAKPLGSLLKIDVTGAVYLLSPKIVSSVRFAYDRQGEDIGFCRSALNQGFQIFCDTSILPLHAMEKERYLAWKKTKPLDGRMYNFVGFPVEVKVPS